MKRFILALVLGSVLSCSDGGLPGNPVFIDYQAAGLGDSLTLYWAPIEGADYYEIYLDGELYWEGVDTSITVPYFQNITLRAYGLGDETETTKSSEEFLIVDTLLVKPQVEALILSGTSMSIKGITDTALQQYFFVFLATNSGSIGEGIVEEEVDSLWLYSASPFFNDLTAHKVDSIVDSPIVNIPALDSIRFYLDSVYVLWYSPDTLGWSEGDYFMLFRADSVEVDSLGDVRLRIIYTVNSVSGLRWF